MEVDFTLRNSWAILRVCTKGTCDKGELSFLYLSYCLKLTFHLQSLHQRERRCSHAKRWNISQFYSRHQGAYFTVTAGWHLPLSMRMERRGHRLPGEGGMPDVHDLSTDLSDLPIPLHHLHTIKSAQPCWVTGRNRPTSAVSLHQPHFCSCLVWNFLKLKGKKESFTPRSH